MAHFRMSACLTRPVRLVRERELGDLGVVARPRERTQAGGRPTCGMTLRIKLYRDDRGPSPPVPCIQFPGDLFSEEEVELCEAVMGMEKEHSTCRMLEPGLRALVEDEFGNDEDEAQDVEVLRPPHSGMRTGAQNGWSSALAL